jgi:dienelactone hydrolase
MKMPFSAALLILIATVIAPDLASASLKAKNVEYKDGNTVLEGYLVFDDAFTGKRPAVLVVHDWMGVGTYTKMRVEQLAQLGYIAFAADIYGKGVRPRAPQEAGAQATRYKSDRKLMRSRVQAGLATLLKNDLVNPGKVVAMGYCFGGTVALELARSGAPLAGTVSVHGGLDTPTPQDAKNIKGAVLAQHGGDDPHVPPQQVQDFENEMRSAGVDWRVIVYGGAVHGFTSQASGNDPSKGAAYNEKADKRSWNDLVSFLSEVFQQQPVRRK